MFVCFCGVVCGPASQAATPPLIGQTRRQMQLMLRFSCNKAAGKLQGKSAISQICLSEPEPTRANVCNITAGEINFMSLSLSPSHSLSLSPLQWWPGSCGCLFLLRMHKSRSELNCPKLPALEVRTNCTKTETMFPLERLMAKGLKNAVAARGRLDQRCWTDAFNTTQAKDPTRKNS